MSVMECFVGLLLPSSIISTSQSYFVLYLFLIIITTTTTLQNLSFTPSLHLATLLLFQTNIQEEAERSVIQ